MADFHEMKHLKQVIEQSQDKDKKDKAMSALIDLMKGACDGRGIFTWHILHALSDADDAQVERIWSSLARSYRRTWSFYQNHFVNELQEYRLSALQHMDITQQKYAVLSILALGESISEVLDPIRKIYASVVTLETASLNNTERNAVFSALRVSFRASQDGRSLFLYHALLKRSGLINNNEDICLAIAVWSTMSGREEDYWREQTAKLVTGLMAGLAGPWRRHLSLRGADHTSRAKDLLDDIEYRIDHDNDADASSTSEDDEMESESGNEASPSCFGWMSEAMMQSLPVPTQETKLEFVDDLLSLLRKHILTLFGASFDDSAPPGMFEEARDVWYAVRLHANGEERLALQVDPSRLSVLQANRGLDKSLWDCFLEGGLEPSGYEQRVEEALYGWNRGTGGVFGLDKEPILSVN